jgi:hypothetical protein
LESSFPFCWHEKKKKSLFYLIQLNHVRRNCLNAPLGDEGCEEIERKSTREMNETSRFAIIEIG